MKKSVPGRAIFWSCAERCRQERLSKSGVLRKRSSLRIWTLERALRGWAAGPRLAHQVFRMAKTRPILVLVLVLVLVVVVVVTSHLSHRWWHQFGHLRTPRSSQRWVQMPSFSITYHQIGNDQNPLRLVGLEDYILPSYVGILVSHYKDGLKAVSWNVDRLAAAKCHEVGLICLWKMQPEFCRRSCACYACLVIYNTWWQAVSV